MEREWIDITEKRKNGRTNRTMLLRINLDTRYPVFILYQTLHNILDKDTPYKMVYDAKNCAIGFKSDPIGKTISIKNNTWHFNGSDFKFKTNTTLKGVYVAIEYIQEGDIIVFPLIKQGITEA